MAKLHIKKGDIVIVNTGKYAGVEGKVLSVDPEKNTAVVEGVNMHKKAVKPSPANPQGGIVEKEAPIHISNINVKDPKTGKPTRIGRREVNGKLVRYSKKSGEEI